MPRREDEAFEEGDDLPRRRRRDEDDDRPRRRHDEEEDDDDEDRPRRRRRRRLDRVPQGNWLDDQFTQTSLPLLVIFPLCCGMIALIFGLVGLVACQTSEGKKRAGLVVGISVIWFAFAVILGLMQQRP